MTITIEPSKLQGKIQAPGSKSSMQRACAAALLTQGMSEIQSPGYSNDDKAALDIIQKLGATIEVKSDSILVNSKGVRPVAETLNCGESGLSIRMFTPLAALSSSPLTITGSGSLLSRPMDFFDEILPAVGVEIRSNAGKLPLDIKGPLVPRDIKINGSLSSQFLTGLLMAYSAAGAEDITITVDDLKSRPYIDLTLGVMKAFGMAVPENKNYKSFYFRSEKTDDKVPGHVTYRVEGDWSGGAFLLVAGAISGKIVVEGLDTNSTQADKAILNAIRESGAELSISDHRIEVGPGDLQAFIFDATDCPDLFPPLVALASYCRGNTKIKGVLRLAHKESNRGLTLQEEFGKMGVSIILNGDMMTVEGGNLLTGAVVHSHHDHRIAMACAVATLGATGTTRIESADAVNKSYPDFYKHLEALGTGMSENIVASSI